MVVQQGPTLLTGLKRSITAKWVARWARGGTDTLPGGQGAAPTHSERGEVEVSGSYFVERRGHTRTAAARPASAVRGVANDQGQNDSTNKPVEHA
jgi:hypothetical protein